MHLVGGLQHGWYLFKKGQGCRHTELKLYEDIERRQPFTRQRERQDLGETGDARILTLNFQPPQLQGNLSVI